MTQFFILSLGLFLVFGLFSAALSLSVSLKGLIPLVYTAYFVPLYYVFVRVERKYLLSNIRLQVACYLLLPILIYFVRNYLLSGFTMALPNVGGGGFTFTYGLALSCCLFLRQAVVSHIVDDGLFGCSYSPFSKGSVSLLRSFSRISIFFSL